MINNLNELRVYKEIFESVGYKLKRNGALLSVLITNAIIHTLALYEVLVIFAFSFFTNDNYYGCLSVVPICVISIPNFL